MTPIDVAHAAMLATPDDDAVRLRFWGTVAEAALFLMLADEVKEDRITPAEVEIEEGHFALAFDSEERLAEFAGHIVASAALSGRRLMRLLAGKGLGVALNPDVAPSAILLGPDTVDWLAELVAGAPAEVEARIEEVFAPRNLPEEVLRALDRRLGLAGSMAKAAWLVDARCAGGVRRHVLAAVGVAPGAEVALAGAVAEALRFSGVDAGAIDVTCLAADSPAIPLFARVGIRIDLPDPADRSLPGPLATGPARPPRLR